MFDGSKKVHEIREIVVLALHPMKSKSESLFIDLLKTILNLYAFSYENCIYSESFNQKREE